MNAVKTKVQLKLAINRLKLSQQKQTSLNAVARQEISKLLRIGKVDSARIRVEMVIRQDLTVEAMELLELYTETLLARFQLLESMRNCDPCLVESVNSVIYGAPRVDIPELLQVRDQLISKFGKEFGQAAMDNLNDLVNPKLIQKLKIATPDTYLVNQYLLEIAKAYKVDWSIQESAPKYEPILPLPIGYSSDLQFPPQQCAGPPSLQDEKKAFQAQDSQESAFPELPDIPSGKTQSFDPDFDELEKRFEALKKKK